MKYKFRTKVGTSKTFVCANSGDKRIDEEEEDEDEYEKEIDESKMDGKKKERGENVDEEEYERVGRV